MKKHIYSIVAMLLTSTAIISQDVHFSLYGESPSVINPALTGVAYDFRANVNYKSQWKSLSGYKTYAANFETAFKHQKLNKAYMAAGFNFYRDVAGDGKFGTTSFNLNLATIIKTGKNSKISLGLTGGATTRTLKNYDALTWESQYDGFKYDEKLASGEYDEKTSFTRADFGGGINWHYSESNLYLSSNNGSRFDIGASFIISIPLKIPFSDTEAIKRTCVTTDMPMRCSVKAEVICVLLPVLFTSNRDQQRKL